MDVQDFGTHGPKSVDYPEFGRQISQQVSQGDADRGILICTTGIGMSILASINIQVFELLWCRI
jgi:ribose 5-phosphate isomerase RpiB